MDAVLLFAHGVGHTVDGLAYHIEQAAVDVFAYGHRDGAAKGHNLHTALQAVGAVHSDGAHRVFADILLAFKNDFGTVGTLHAESVVDVGERYVGVERHINDSADDL